MGKYYQTKNLMVETVSWCSGFSRPYSVKRGPTRGHVPCFTHGEFILSLLTTFCPYYRRGKRGPAGEELREPGTPDPTLHRRGQWYEVRVDVGGSPQPEELKELPSNIVPSPDHLQSFLSQVEDVLSPGFPSTVGSGWSSYGERRVLVSPLHPPSPRG